MTSFTKELLSATAPGQGSPTLLAADYPLSSTNADSNTIDVAVHTLSATDTSFPGAVVGIAFTPLTITSATSTLSAANLAGSTVSVAVGYHGQTFGLVLANRTSTLFTYNSAATTQFVRASANTVDVTYPGKRRKWLLGYF